MKIHRVVRIVPPAAEPCRYCIDGFMPGTTAFVVGEYYVRCSYCQDSGAITTCRSCRGTALFPAAFKCLACFLDHCMEQGYRAVLCVGCTGVLDLVPTDDEDTP